MLKILLATTMLIGYNTLHITNVNSPDDLVCHKADTLESDLKADDGGNLYVWHFNKTDSDSIDKSIVDLFKSNGYTDSEVALVYWKDDQSAGIYHYGMDGCFTSTTFSDADQIWNVINHAGLAVPYGKTYIQLPPSSYHA